MINVYQLGDAVVLTKVFDEAPTGVSVAVNPPSAEVVIYTTDQSPASLTEGASNDFQIEIQADEAGTWYYEWRSSEEVDAFEFVVQPSNAPEPAA